ncbi:MAG: class I SAM-dependent methyltransferase [Actinobacteria bacterium]|nr:class I SAM-dependent methyltransferase [Actinomycetota bacterium]
MTNIAVKWLAKAAVQRVISFSPHKHELNHRLQRFTGRDGIDGGHVVNRASMVRRHLQALEMIGVERSGASLPAGTSVLELGTGWHPVVPMIFFLVGADRIVTVDHVDHLTAAALAHTAQVVLGAVDDGSLRGEVGDLVPERVELLRSLAGSGATTDLATSVAALRLERAIGDVMALRLDEPVDIVVSNHVLEHLPEAILAPVLAACFELCRPGGVMSHAADMIDHGHYVDERLGEFNFLRFTERQWRIVGNDVQYENRLRLPSYRAAYAAAGVPIDHEEVLRSDVSEILRIPIAREFRHLSLDDLAVQFAWFVSLRPAVDGSA